MFLSLAPTQGLRLKPQLLCGVCGGDLENKDENLASVALFGAVRYGACPICYAEIDKNLQKERGFRNRWTRAFKRKMGIPAGRRIRKSDFCGYFGIK